MPYLNTDQKAEFEVHGEIKVLVAYITSLSLKDFKGALNYLNFLIARTYLKVVGNSYYNISTVVNAVEDSAKELRRRLLDPYEDKKIKQNGDVEAKP